MYDAADTIPDAVHGAVQLEILALRPAVTASALEMARNEKEADQLAQLTIDRAFAGLPRQGMDRELDLRSWLFRLLRSEFHSIGRQREARRERGFTVAARQTADPTTNL